MPNKKSISFIILEIIFGSCMGVNYTSKPAVNVPKPAQSIVTECAIKSSYSYYYAYNTGSNDLSPYSIESQSGQLISISSSISKIVTGVRPAGITASSDGNYIYVSGQIDNTISVFRHSCIDGSLTRIQLVSESFGVSPFTVTLSPDGNYLYVPNYTTNNISMYTVNKSTGTLTPLLTSYAPNGVVSTNGVGSISDGGALSFKFEHTGKYAYAGNYGSSTISLFKYDSTTGDLIYIQSFSSNGIGPRRVMADNNGHLFVLNEFSNNISAYNINFADGTLSLINTFTTGVDPIYMFVTSSGKFLYVSNAGENTLSQYQILKDGNLKGIGKVRTAGNPRDFYICKDKYLYIGVSSENKLNIFSINSLDGSLTSMSEFAIAAGIAPSGGVCI